MKNGVVHVTAALAATVATLTACANAHQPATSSGAGVPAGTERMTSQLKSAEGAVIANATFDFANGYATVTVEAGPNAVLAPGFHGLHIHSVGKCEAGSVAPAGGATGDFNSAGGHYQAPGHTGHPASGDLTSLEVRPDGSAKLVTTTSAFSAADLRNSSGTALIIHQGADNFGNIPPARYAQRDGTPGPDQETLATGDAGKRVACGVIAAATPTVTSAETPTITPTETPPATGTTPATTVTTTTVVAPPPSVSTSTSTVTVTSTPAPASTSTTSTPPKTVTTPVNPSGG